MPNNNQPTICQYLNCGKPLGQESQDLGFLVCHEHRKCFACSEPLSAQEVQLCFQLAHDAETDPPDIAHPRCLALSRKAPEPLRDPVLSIKQSYLDYLNHLRFMIIPDMELSVATNENNAMIHTQKIVSEMSGDEKFAHLKMLEACIAQTRIAIGQDRELLKRRADEREKGKFAEAAKQAKTSSRPTNKKPDDEAEVLLGAFMERNGITDRKAAQKLKKERDAAIQGLMSLGVSREAAMKSIDDNLIKQGRMKA